MNVLLIEQAYLSSSQKETDHVLGHSLAIAFALREYSERIIYVLAKKDSYYEKIALAKGLKVLHEPAGLFTALSFASLIKKYNISIVHTFDYMSARFVCSFSLFTPAVSYIHSENRYTEKEDIFLEKTFKNTKAFVFADKSLRKHYITSLTGRKIFVQPITFSEELECISEESKKLPSLREEGFLSAIKGKRKVRLLIPCSLVCDEQMHTIMHALHLFNEYEGSSFKWEAYFVGIGGDLNKIIEFAKEYNILEYICIFEQNENLYLYKCSDICILPVHKEYNLSPLLYAWYFKLPLLATKALLYCEEAQNSKNIHMPESETPIALSSSLHRLIHDVEYRCELVEKASQTMVNFANSSTKENYINLYNEIIQNKENK